MGQKIEWVEDKLGLVGRSGHHRKVALAAEMRVFKNVPLISINKTEIKNKNKYFRLYICKFKNFMRKKCNIYIYNIM